MRFSEDLESVSFVKREAIDDAIRHMYSNGCRIYVVYVVQEVKLLAKKEDRFALNSAISELIHLGMQRLLVRLLELLSITQFGSSQFRNHHLCSWCHITHLFLQLGYSSPAQYGIVHDLHLLPRAIVGAILSGRIADFVGRRLATGFAEVFCILG